MDNKQLRAKLLTLLKEKKNIEQEIESIEKEFVKQLCPKGKQECEPAFCVFFETNTCPFLKEWREILDRID